MSQGNDNTVMGTEEMKRRKRSGRPGRSEKKGERKATQSILKDKSRERTGRKPDAGRGIERLWETAQTGIQRV